MRLRCLSFSLLVLGGLCGTGRADGLVFRLPEDKHWVRFDTEVQIEGQPNPFPGSVTLKSVGSTFEDGEKCRWIELEFKLKTPEGNEQLRTFKMLLPEKNLKAGANPIEKIVRGWFKVDDQGAMEFKDTTNLAVITVAVFFTGPPADAKPLDKQFEDSKLGNLECEGVRGTHEVTLSQSKLKLTSEIRKHDKAPFGVVRAEYQFEVANENNEKQAKGTVRLKLADFGTDATSGLPDSQ